MKIVIEEYIRNNQFRLFQIDIVLNNIFQFALKIIKYLLFFSLKNKNK